MNKPRKIIFECRTGSHLYGTMTPTSDEDFMGVFLPGSNDLFNLEQCPTEWDQGVKLSTGVRNSAGDIDRKYYSLQKFLSLAMEGQSNQTEMLYAPAQAIITRTPEWDEIMRHRDVLVSAMSISSMVGFCVAQSIKACSKGDNLNQIRSIIAALAKHAATTKIADAMASDSILSENLGRTTNKEGVNLLIVAGKKWDFHATVKRVNADLKKMESKYGQRSRQTADSGFDYRSLSHAYRLVGEAREFISTGTLTLPRPQNEVDLMLSIKRGQYVADYFTEIESHLAQIRAIPLHPSIRLEPAREIVRALCNRMLSEYFFGKE
jgi:predicted nucleotidyltransferase